MHCRTFRIACLICLVSLFLPGANPALTLGADPATNTTPGVLRYEEPRHLTGSIYGLGADKDKLLYKFQRAATRTGNKLTVQRDYTSPDGRLAARERAVYLGDDLLSYELAEPTIGSQGTATVKRDSRKPDKTILEFTFSSQEGAKPKTETESLRDNTLVNDMLAPFLASHWDDLVDGQKVKCRYVVVPRKETVGFTFVKESDSTWRNQSVMIVKMEPTSPVISALVDPLYFTLQKAPPHRILQYVGRTTPKIQAGTKWKDLDAVTIFDWDSAR